MRDDQKPQWLKDAEKNNLMGKVTTVNEEALYEKARGMALSHTETVAAGQIPLGCGNKVIETIAGLPRIVEYLSGLNEEQFQFFVVKYAQSKGWRVAHCRRARVGYGDGATWRTPMSADGNGWVDLAMCNPATGVSLFVELKTETGKQSPEQVAWADWLIACNLNYRLWRPAEWPAIMAELAGEQ